MFRPFDGHFQFEKYNSFQLENDGGMVEMLCFKVNFYSEICFKKFVDLS